MVCLFTRIFLLRHRVHALLCRRFLKEFDEIDSISKDTVVDTVIDML